jgi:DNA repair protein RadD
VILRDYQQDGVAQIAAAYARGAKRVLYVLPTGGGKTEVFRHIAERLSGSKRVIVAAHRRELIKQAVRRMPAAVSVGSVQTLANRRLAYDVGILDEAHHAVAKNYRRMMDQIPLWLGVTATPERLDGQGLGDVFDAIVVGPQSGELCEAGHLAPIEAYAPERPPDIRKVHVQAGDYMTRELALVMDRPTVTGDAVQHYQRYAAGEPSIVFCVSVQHAINTAEAFNLEGWSALPVYGGMGDDARDRAISGIADGTYTHLMSCALIDEGLDVPGVSCIIDLAPTQSLSRWLQRIGRGRRPPGRCVLLDHAGNMTQRHGWPDWPREWSLAGTPKRARTAPAIAQCPECYAIHPPGPACPACGHDYETAAREHAAREAEQRAGELSRMTLEDHRLMHLKTAPLRDLVRGAANFDDMDEIRKARGYHVAWTSRMMRYKPRQVTQSNTI